MRSSSFEQIVLFPHLLLWKTFFLIFDDVLYNDTLNWSDITPICEFITELDFNTDFDLITEFWRFP